MRLFKIFFLPIFFSMFFSCNNRPTIRIISKYPNGNTQETYTYKNSIDTLSYVYTNYYENGKLKIHGNYLNNKKEGAWVWYFSNGILSDSATYRNAEFVERRVHWDSLGKLTKLEIITGPCYDCCCDGLVISYYSNGKTESEAHMQKGKEQGKYVFYYDNGQPKKEEYFSEGIKEGNYYEWYATGKRWVNGFYRQGKMDSIWTWYDSTGTVNSIRQLKSGELIKDIK
jgi:uncharacterized protein